MTKTVKVFLIVGVAAVFMVAVIVSVLIVFFVSGWRSGVRKANEAAAVSNLRMIEAAELQYFNLHSLRFASFKQLVAEQMLDGRFDSEAPLVDGYVFHLKITNDAPSSVVINADPESSETQGRHFYMDSKDGIIRSNRDHPATSFDPAYVQ